MINHHILKWNNDMKKTINFKKGKVYDDCLYTRWLCLTTIEEGYSLLMKLTMNISNPHHISGVYFNKYGKNISGTVSISKISKDQSPYFKE